MLTILDDDDRLASRLYEQCLVLRRSPTFLVVSSGLHSWVLVDDLHVGQTEKREQLMLPSRHTQFCLNNNPPKAMDYCYPCAVYS
jgi:hypothetical protein